MQGIRRPKATLLLVLTLFGVLSYLLTNESDLEAAPEVHRALRLARRYANRVVSGTQAHQNQRAGDAGGFSAVAGAFVQGNVLVDGNGDVLRDDPVVGRLEGEGEGDTCGAPRRLPRPRGVRMFPPLKIKLGRSHQENKRIQRYEGCLRYECAGHGEEHCRDPFAATNYDGPNPPCCHHILRDMLKAFDRAMCGLGLEYVVAYGSLLGLVRDDHVIPWTGDNDFMVDFGVAREMWDHRAYFEAHFGLRLMHDFFFRMCLTEDFAGGDLAKWKTNKYDLVLDMYGGYVDFFPYADLFYGEVHPGLDRFATERGCGYDVGRYFPLRRVAVYGAEFHVYVPGNVEEVLEADYGEGWGVPKDHLKHGCSKIDCHPKCEGYDPKFIRRWSSVSYDNEWIARWNSILENNYTDAAPG